MEAQAQVSSDSRSKRSKERRELERCKDRLDRKDRKRTKERVEGDNKEYVRGGKLRSCLLPFARVEPEIGMR